MDAGINAILKAVDANNIGQVNALIREGVNVNATNARGTTLLQIAIARNLGPMALKLVELEATATQDMEGSLTRVRDRT